MIGLIMAGVAAAITGGIISGEYSSSIAEKQAKQNNLEI